MLYLMAENTSPLQTGHTVCCYKYEYYVLTICIVYAVLGNSTPNIFELYLFLTV